jgi:hypothetical protein
MEDERANGATVFVRGWGTAQLRNYKSAAPARSHAHIIRSTTELTPAHCYNLKKHRCSPHHVLHGGQVRHRALVPPEYLGSGRLLVLGVQRVTRLGVNTAVACESREHQREHVLARRWNQQAEYGRQG